ncbi:hypothetical protein VI26_10985 [Chromobacterium sp. LK1]|uniref:DUF3304 domain-containing protein n=1 Tax=Chromobacterium sp. LK1 TaxID=1628193 RepID=UPI0006538C0D|nr:DUF3304 domain-containing protein [Chromobacterium sp. LK1]KMN35535.1 hypothetical protein VI26_10985 [Chromobacterium sp. LK1]
MIGYLAPCLRLVAGLLLTAALSGCAALGSDKTGVSLTAVNYTDEDYDVVGITRADDPEQLEAMERVAAYAGSGTMCCVSLPTQWRPGLKVVVKTRLGTKAKTYQEWAYEKIPLRTHELDVPRYEEPATLWVQILDSGKLAAVVSRYDPPHANWPGAVKGWPRPSAAYQNKKLILELNREKELLTVMENASKKPGLSVEQKKNMDWAISDIKKSILKLENRLK